MEVLHRKDLGVGQWEQVEEGHFSAVTPCFVQCLRPWLLFVGSLVLQLPWTWVTIPLPRASRSQGGCGFLPLFLWVARQPWGALIQHSAPHALDAPRRVSILAPRNPAALDFPYSDQSVSSRKDFLMVISPRSLCINCFS